MVSIQIDLLKQVKVRWYMIEIPEAEILSMQLTETIGGKRIMVTVYKEWHAVM